MPKKEKKMKRTITFYCTESLLSLMQKRADDEEEGNISKWLRKAIKRELQAKRPVIE